MTSKILLLSATAAALVAPAPSNLRRNGARCVATRASGASVADWRAACDAGVVSFHDFGVRLTATAAPASGDKTALDSARYAGREYAKYALATGGQYYALLGVAAVVDKYAPTLPRPAVWVLFAFLSLRSRVLSPLDNSRPDRDAQGGAAVPEDVKRPGWTPPGVAFPIIWLTITGLRATAAAMAYAGSLRAPALSALLLHLCVGDTWNTVTNVERRLGVSAVGVAAVWYSCLNAVRAFAKSPAPAAAAVLAPSLAWISVACVLTCAIWRLNGCRPLYPSEGDGSSAATRLKFLLQLQPSSIGGK